MFSYLAKRFGLKAARYCRDFSPEQELNARQLTEIQEFVKAYKTIYPESSASSKVAETLIKSTGVRKLNPLEADPK